MNMRNILATLFLLIVGLMTPAQATIIVNDNFDGYANQAAFQASWPAIGSGSPSSAVLSTAQADSPPNSVHVPGTITNNQYRNRKSFTDTIPLVVGDKIVWSFDFYDAAPTANPARNYSNLQDTIAPGSTNQLIAMGMNNNQIGSVSGGQFYMARILGYSPLAADPNGGPGEGGTLGSGAFFKLNDFGVGSRSLGWHKLKVVISSDDLLSTDYAFYVDGALAELVSNVGTAASMRLYDNIVIGSGLSNGTATIPVTEAFFDNMRLVQVPEPTSLLLAGLLGVALGCARTRR